MKILPLEPGLHGAWDRFVATRPEATFFHQAAMGALVARVFRHRDRSFAVAQDGEIVGILPLVEMRTRLFGHALISLPFCVYGGPVAADREAHGALLREAARLQRETGGATLELRDARIMGADAGLDPAADAAADPAGDRDADAAALGFRDRHGLYATFRRAITGDDEANLKAIPRKQRAVVRKGIERGLTAETGTDGATAWRIYAESVRDLGSPVFPRRWFEALVSTFPGQVDTTVVRDAGRDVSAVLSLHWRDAVLPYYGGGVPAARSCHAYDFMYWTVMRNAAARGARTFDFGRSKEGTGAYAFKKNWGFPPTPLAYRFLVAPGRDIPEHNPLNPKYRLVIEAWKRLPLPVANLLGPHLVRGIG